MKVNYLEIGLSNTQKMFADAMKNRYAVPAYNFNNMEQLQAIIMACVESQSPVILQVSKWARSYANSTLLRYMAKWAVEMAKELWSQIPIALHLDHGDSFDICKECIDSGFSSVMIDGSHLSYEKNIELTKQVVDYAHGQENYVSVEWELGVLAGIEDDVVAEVSTYTKPAEVIDFVARTGVDSLAISIWTSHWAYKFTPEQCVLSGDWILVPPPLRFDILKEIEKEMPGFPIVLHWASSVLTKYVDIINKNWWKLKSAVWIPEEQLRQASKSSVCKINIDSDGRLVVTAIIRKILSENPVEFDPRKYFGPAREELKNMIIHKNQNVLGSAGRY